MAVRRAAVAWAATLIVSCGLLAMPLVAFAATSAVNIQNSAFAPASVTASAPAPAAETATASPSPSAVAVQLTPAPVSGAGPGPLLFGAAALAVVALGAIAFYLVRRS